jgi:hypothetical protein
VPDARRVRQARVPWEQRLWRFTALFGRLAIDVLPDGDIAGGCAILRIS